MFLFRKLTTAITNKIIFFRYTPSQGDVSVFDALGKAPNAKFPHALRWYSQISSYNSSERSKFQGEKLDLAKSAPTPAAADDDDDDVDLFGSDDEEEEVGYFF